MPRKIGWHGKVQMLKVPSVDALPFLIMCCRVFQLGILDAPAAIAHYSLLCGRFEIRVEWLLSLVKSGLVAESCLDVEFLAVLVDIFAFKTSKSSVHFVRYSNV